MYVGGEEVSVSHKLHRAGRYRSWDDAWSHNEIESTNAGFVYIITNPAYEGWIKVGKAMDADDRLRNYQTSSPFRDYEIHHSRFFLDRHAAERTVHDHLRLCAHETSCEWFFIDKDVAANLINNLPECN